MDIKTTIIIQARMTSSRLPGKTLMKINNRPLLFYVYSRISKSKIKAKIVIATSVAISDDPIQLYCRNNHILYFRGNLSNVLDRYYQCAIKYHSDIIIRITADCPLIDSSLIDSGYNIFLKKKYDYLSNSVERTYPRGFDFEIFNFKTLKYAWKNANKAYELEHVTPYIYKNRKFSIFQLKQKRNKSKYSVTVDTIQDFKLIDILIKQYHADKKNYQEIIKILDNNPKLFKINEYIEQKNIC